jgi:hypothetical protein
MSKPLDAVSHAEFMSNNFDRHTPLRILLLSLVNNAHAATIRKFVDIRRDLRRPKYMTVPPSPARRGKQQKPKLSLGRFLAVVKTNYGRPNLLLSRDIKQLKCDSAADVFREHFDQGRRCEV